MTAETFFNAARAHKRALTGNALDGLDEEDERTLKALERRWEARRDR